MIDFTSLPYHEQQRLYQIQTMMGEVVLSASDLGLSDKQLHHWKRENILFQSINKDKQPTFNFVESLWILLALELRSYGFSLNELRNVRQFLMESDINWLIDAFEQGFLTDTFIDQIDGKLDGQNISFRNWIDEGGLEISKATREEKPIENSNLYGHVILSLIRDTPYTLAFNHQGLIHLDWDYDFSHLKTNFQHGEFKSDSHILTHIMHTGGVIISLDHLISKLVLIEPKDQKRTALNLLLSEAEQEIIHQIRSNKDTLTVKIDFKEKEPVMFHFKTEIKNVSDMAQLATLIRKHKYEDVVIKNQSGSIVYVTRTSHVKVVKQITH